MAKGLLPFYLFTLLPLFASCSHYLDADNKASLDAESYFSTPEGQVALRVALYNGIRPMVNNTDLTEYGTKPSALPKKAVGSWISRSLNSI